MSVVWTTNSQREEQANERPTSNTRNVRGSGQAASTREHSESITDQLVCFCGESRSEEEMSWWW
jgi:hypothetical protein